MFLPLLGTSWRKSRQGNDSAAKGLERGWLCVEVRQLGADAGDVIDVCLEKDIDNR